jgi:hypothetical protein
LIEDEHFETMYCEDKGSASHLPSPSCHGNDPTILQEPFRP